MVHNDSFDLYLFLRSELAPRELHMGNRESGELTPDACDFIAATIHDWFWQKKFESFLCNHKLQHLSIWLEDLLLDTYDADEEKDIIEVLNQLRVINSRRQRRDYYFDADLLSLFEIEEDKSIGVTDLHALPIIASRYKHLSFIETTETNVIDRVLCDIYGVPIAGHDERQDVILSHLSENPSILLSQIEDSTEVVLMQVGKNSLFLDMDGLQSIKNKSREIIQIGVKNDSAYNNYFLINSFTPPSSVSLALEYYPSLSEFKYKERAGRWVFKTVDRPKEERLKPRVETYDIKEMWSIFPSDYTLFGNERSFKVNTTLAKESSEEPTCPRVYPIYLINNALDDFLLINNCQELSQYLRKCLKNKGQSELLLYIEGNTRIIPSNNQTLERLLLKATLFLASFTSNRKGLYYWLPFLRNEGAANVLTKDEAKYRLLEWLAQHKPDAVEQWSLYCATKVSYPEETTLGEKAYDHLKLNYDLEILFPFLTDESALTDMSMNLIGWSQSNENGKREYRKQPIRNLMLAALGINREQFKYIQKLNKQ